MRVNAVCLLCKVPITIASPPASSPWLPLPLLKAQCEEACSKAGGGKEPGLAGSTWCE